MQRFVIALTGASGSVYCQRLVHVLSRQEDTEVYLLASDTGLRVASHELKTPIPDSQTVAKVFADPQGDGTVIPLPNDFEHAVASGSFEFTGMIVVPCTRGRLASIVSGVSRDLIDRTAEVALKEKRTLILVHRETPLSLVHLQNMTRLTEAGGMILPANPSFYHRPETIREQVDYVVARICSHLGVSVSLIEPWVSAAISTGEDGGSK